MSWTVPEAIRLALRRRGISLRPDDGGRDDLAITTWRPELRDLLYAEMQRYSFRLVLRDLLRLGNAGPVQPQDLTRHVGVDVVMGYLQALEQLAVVEQDEERWRLLVPASTLGPTLEWFVAEVLRRELGFCVAWSLPLRGGTTGGDLDVVALAEGQFLFVEVKSGPPKHLQRSQVGAFLDRVEALAPHGAIFFEDTELRMTDKVVVMFEEELSRRGLGLRPQRLHRELYHVGPKVFIANAHPEVVSNLSRCVRELFRACGVRLEIPSGQV